VKVVLTGHHGYIGSVTAEELRAAGHEVVGLDTYFYLGCDFGTGGEPSSPERIDVRSVAPEALDGADAVVHLAALSNDPLGALSPELTLEINYRASEGIARAAREAGVPRFVFASSCSMYGAAADGLPRTEESPLAPLTAYAESKVRSEEALRTLATDSFSPVFMRNATAYGVSPRLRLDIVLNNLAAWAHTTGKIRILSDGTPWRPLVHIRDISRATIALLEAPREAVHAESFNIGHDADTYQVRELAEIVRDASDGCEVEIAGAGDPDPRSYKVDFGKFARVFPGFEYQWDAPRGARELLDAFRDVGLTFADFEGNRFIRLNQLNRLRADGSLDETLHWRAAD
jgi:nucleoside-diphosphate-sugar epimerase